MGKKRKHVETVPEIHKEQQVEQQVVEDRTKYDNQTHSGPTFRNKEKVLVTCSRRINFRYRHLMLNLVSLLPHCKKENKVESKAALNELVELRSCSSCLFFESRKETDLYLWMAKCPTGPSVKFLVNAVHTIEELKLTGNHLNNSRPLLTFSSSFGKDTHWKLLKEMITQIFGTPKDQRRTTPYYDHVFAFSIVDDRIWFRNYQISCPRTEAETIDQEGLKKMTLVEVGPRFCLNPIKIFGGSFGGQTLYENPFYVSPNQIRSSDKKQKAGKYTKKVKAKIRKKMQELSKPLEEDEFADTWED
ncbi:hypothetical protein AgCh_037806 [Apium graveolens]